MSYTKIYGETIVNKAEVIKLTPSEFGKENVEVIRSYTNMNLNTLMARLRMLSASDDFAKATSCDDSDTWTISLRYQIGEKVGNVTLVDCWTICDPYCVELTSDIVKDSIRYQKDLPKLMYEKYYGSEEPFPCAFNDYYQLYFKQTVLEQEHEYLYKVVDKLIADGFTYMYLGNVEDIHHRSIVNIDTRLLCIPEENWKVIYDNYYFITSNKHKTLGEFLSSAAKAGYLKFEPYVTVNSGNHVTLVLKYNRYVHLFRDYYYQVSCTPNGVGEYATAGLRIDLIKRLFDDIPSSQLLESLYYMNCIAACTGIDEFDDTLKNKPEVIDSFVKASVKHVLPGFNTTYADLRRYELYNDNDQLSLEATYIYHVPQSQTMDICRLYDISTNYPRFVVEYVRDGAICAREYNFSDMFENVNEWELAEDYGRPVDAIKAELSVAIYNNPEVYSELVMFILNTIGIKCNFMVTYSINKCETLPAINKPNTIRIDSLNNVYDHIKKLNSEEVW
jgi:hypothetical protein